MTLPTLITSDDGLASLASRLADVPRLALDCEGNGLHAYRARLCCLQLAWPEDDGTEVAIVDTLLLDLDPLHALFGPDGPVKVLHDLTFDARMLADRDVPLGNVRDTSVAARFLAEPATGLANLVDLRLGVVLEKGLQHHDWADRPFTERQLEYLAGDVRHLLALDTQLATEVEELDITEEVRLECDYKLLTALGPPKDRRLPHERVKGYKKLGRLEQAVLEELCLEREAIAESQDRPPFKIASNAALFEVAKRKPSSNRALRSIKHRSLHRQTRRWLTAVERGLIRKTPSASPTPEPVTMRRAEINRRKALDAALSTWRREEAERRGVDLQVVLPGHCTSAVVGAMAEADEDSTLVERLRAIPGLGEVRLQRYAEAWLELRATPPASERPEEPQDEDPRPR